MNNAKWIKAPKLNTLPCFKKKIILKNTIKKAELKITSMGFYRVMINKKMITKNVFMPGWTSFLNRVQYQTYNVTNLLKHDSTLEILLGEGWGGAKRLAWPTKEYPYFEPSLIFSLEITSRPNHSIISCRSEYVKGVIYFIAV